MTFSPTPWNPANYNGRICVEAGPDAESIAELCLDHDQAINAANARLITAAPDLLAAAKAVLPFIEADEPDYSNDDPYGLAIRQLRAAISKAKGGAA